MGRSRTSLVAGALAVVTAVTLVAGCSHSSGHPASSPTSHRPTAPASVTSRSKTAVSSTVANPSSAANRADLAALTQQLDAAGSSLGAADTALAQTDPNQTKNSEGSVP